MKILLSNVGSFGDIAPFLWLAKILQIRGHQTMVAIDPMFSESAESMNIKWFDIGGLSRQKFNSAMKHIFLNDDAGIRSVEAGKIFFGDRAKTIEKNIRTILTSEPFDWFVCGEPMLYLPNEVFSTQNVALIMHSVMGIEQIQMYKDRDFSLTRLSATSSHMLPLPTPSPEWSQVGPIVSDRFHTQELTAELVAFLDSNKPTVMVTMGSMVGLEPSRFFPAIVEGILSAGCRVLLQIPSTSEFPIGLFEGKDLMVTKEIDYSNLMPRLSAIVMHGGAGTVNAAARAGCPIVFVPQLVDQKVWAKLLFDIGVSPGWIEGTVDSKSMSTLIRQAIESPHISRAAQNLSQRLRSEPDGAHTICKILESERSIGHDHLTM